MNTGELLKSLLDIANLKQKAFAESMYASPSKISKIINGKLTISAAEARSFSEQAARFFADELYEDNCYFKFRDIFPVILDFSSWHDLNDFLFSAFQYSIEQDIETAEHPDGRNYRNKYYSGSKQILYMYCIILSDYLKRDLNEPLELYSSLQRFFGFYANLMNKVIILLPEKRWQLRLNQFYNQDHLNTLAQEYKSDILMSLFKTELFADLYRWQLNVDASKPFLLVQGKFIMLFDRQIDGTPQLALIRNPSELNHFNDLIMDKLKEARCMTFNSDTIQEYLDREAAKTESLEIDKKIKVLLSTTPAGYGREQEGDQVANFYGNLLEDGTSIYMSADSIATFLFKAEVIVPDLLTVDLDVDARIDYLTRIRNYVDSIKQTSVNVINTPLNSLSLLLDGDWSLISLVHPLSQKVKYHIFASDLIGPELENARTVSGINVSDYIDRQISHAAKYL